MMLVSLILVVVALLFTSIDAFSIIKGTVVSKSFLRLLGDTNSEPSNQKANINKDVKQLLNSASKLGSAASVGALAAGVLSTAPALAEGEAKPNPTVFFDMDINGTKLY